MWKKMCISVFFSGNQIFQKKMCVWFFFGLGWWVYQNLGDLLKWTSAQNPTDVAFSSPFSWNKVTKQTIRKKICVEIELNFMRWQEASKKSDDINWHHWDPSWAYPGAWTSVVFLSRKKPIASHSSLHQHSYFSITSASSLAYQHPRLDISRQILVESRDPTIFQNAPLFPTVPSYPARGTRPRGRVCIAKPPQINVIMNEKMPFLETPQLDPTKIGFDKSNMENFPYQSYPVLPSAEMMSLQGTFSLCELPFFLVPQLLVDFFQQRLCPKQTSLLHLSAPGKYVYI